jgi:hypothetical protein
VSVVDDGDAGSQRVEAVESAGGGAADPADAGGIVGVGAGLFAMDGAQRCHVGRGRVVQRSVDLGGRPIGARISQCLIGAVGQANSGLLVAICDGIRHRPQPKVRQLGLSQSPGRRAHIVMKARRSGNVSENPGGAVA